MHRTIGDGYITDPVGGQNVFADEDPPGRDATQLRHQEANAYQEEIANVVLASGLSLNSASESVQDMVQLDKAIDIKDDVVNTKIDDLGSDDIENESGVTGTTVSDALNTLEDAIDNEITDTTKLALQVKKIHEVNNSLVAYDLNIPDQIGDTVRKMNPERIINGLNIQCYETGPGIGDFLKCNALYLSSGSAELEDSSASDNRLIASTSNFLPGRLFNDSHVTLQYWSAGGSQSSPLGKLAAGVTLPSIPMSTIPTLWVFYLYNPITGAVDIAVDSSPTAAKILVDSNILSAGFSMYRRICAIMIDDNGSWYYIRKMYQVDQNSFHLYQPIIAKNGYVSTVFSAGADAVALNFPTAKLDDCMQAIIDVRAFFDDATTNAIYLYSGETVSAQWTNPDYEFQWNNADILSERQYQIRIAMDKSAADQYIYVNKGFSDSNAQIYIALKGWIDNRQYT